MNVKCKHCGQDYEVDESMTGSSAECEVCAGKFVITPIIESESVPPVTVMAEVENEDDNLILGLYRLEGEVAEGGMGKVYRVHHTSWNVDLAMKQPHAHMFETQAQKDTFAHECDAWINLGLHPHIVSCYYVREIDGIPSIFAEWMEGGNLTHAVRDGKIDSLERILDIAIQFAWGLGYAHEQGLIHQDVKPENVMLDSEGGVKVTDFGIANAKRDIAISTSMTSQFDGTMISEAGAYTPAYCSPEQANKDKLTKRTDIWSWAVSVLEMFLGERLWESGVVAGMACDEYFESVKVPIPESVKDLLRNCFKENEAERPHDFKTIADKLLGIYQSETGNPYKRTEPAPAVDTPDSLNNRALSYIDMGQLEKAEQIWEQALKIDALHLESTYNQGLHLWRSARIDDMKLVRRLENVRHGYAGSWQDEYLLAMIHLDRCDAESALPLLESVISPSNNDPDVVNAMNIAKNMGDVGQCLRTFKGHSHEVNSVRFSPDGKFALSGGYGAYKQPAEMKLWGVASGQCLRNFGHTDFVFSVAFSPDGKSALSGSRGCTLKLWNVANGQCLQNFEGHTGGVFNGVNSVAFSPDGIFVLSGSGDETLKLWNVVSGECLRTFKGHSHKVNSVRFSPDGIFALSGSKDKTLKLWNVVSGECLRTFKGHSHEVNSVRFSPDGKFALSGGYGAYKQPAEMKLWNVVSGECLRTFEGHAGHVTSVNFSPDGKLALSGSNDCTLKLWNVKTGECLRTFKGHTKRVNSVSFSPDGRFALSGSSDETLKLWDIPTFTTYSDWELCKIHSSKEALELEQRLKTAFQEAEKNFDNGNVDQALLTVTNAQAVPGCERISRLLDLKHQVGQLCRITAFNNGWLKESFEGHTEVVWSVTFSPDGKSALSGSWDKTLKLWDISSGQCLRTFEEHGHVTSVNFSPDGKLALSGSNDCTLKLWNVKTGECLRSFEGSSVSFSPNGKFTLSGSPDGTIKLWDVANGQCLRTFEGHENQVDSVSFSPDGKFALSADWATLKLWDVTSGQYLHTLKKHRCDVSSVIFSPDGKYALSEYGAEHMLELWDVFSGQSIRTFEGSSVSFSPNGKYALSGSFYNTLKLWDMENGTCIRTFDEKVDSVYSITFSPDGKFALSGSEDGTLKLWRLDWKYEFPGWTDWDDGAEPYLRNFLTLRERQWSEDDFNYLINDLQNRGYGWLRPEGVRKKLDEMKNT